MKEVSVPKRRAGFKTTKRSSQRPEQSSEERVQVPDFMARLRKIYGDKVLAVSGADLIAADRDR
jgi:hypothetical protein